MKGFVRKIVWFVLLLIVPMAAIYVVCYFQKEKKYSVDTIYVWGDSQMVQGLDLTLVSSCLSRQVLSSARHAGGVYDFLVSIEHIPESSTCIIEFPESAFFRTPRLDYNRTGLELHSLWSMIQVNAPLQECIRIFILNRSRMFSCQNVFSSNHTLYPFVSELQYPQPLSRFYYLFNIKSVDSDWKIATYEYGLSQLNKKGCRIVFIQFPFEKQVEQYAKQSVNRILSERVKNRLLDEFTIVTDTISLPNDSLQMYDLSHLNEVGARHVALEVAKAMQQDTVCNRFFFVELK
ncbi:MAG: hypothetical protein II670_06815 [Alphaproteobacteria bacterium]|nr:hypothetical protein [Alphaproteobacteria bacterium]